MNDSYNAARAIEQTCLDLVESYGQLAEEGANVLGNIKSVIGQLKQWKYTVTHGQSGHTSVEYRDDPYAWWEKALIWTGGMSFSEEVVDHPRKQEALDALAQTQGIVDDADEKFELDAGHMRDSVTSIAEHMSGWVDVSSRFSQLVYASSASQIPTSGDLDGWRSPSASDTYGENVTLQHDAHETTATSIETMLNRDAEFLSSMGTHLTQFAELERAQYDYYVGLATESWVPDEWSIDAIINIAGTIGEKVGEYKSLQIAEIEALVTTLNSAVTDILQTESQKNELNRMSEPTGAGGVGWPMPAALSGRKGVGESSFEDLKFQTQYFKDHIEYWADMSGDFDAVIDTAANTPAIETMFHQLPGFMATTAAGLNSLAEHIVDAALRRGKQAAAELSEILDGTIRTYLEGEDLNAAEARRLEEMLDE